MNKTTIYTADSNDSSKSAENERGEDQGREIVRSGLSSGGSGICECLFCDIDRVLNPFHILRVQMWPMDFDNLETLEYWVIH